MSSYLTSKNKCRLVTGSKVCLFACLLTPPLLHAEALKEGVGVEMTLRTGIKHDDNISQAADSQQKSRSVIHAVEPGIKFGASGSKVTLLGEYSLLSESYVYDSDDDHTDHNFTFDSELRQNRRNTFGFNVSYHEAQAARTSVNRADPNEKSGDRSSIANLDGRYLFGAASAAAQLELQAGHERKRYDNNMNTLSGNRFREYDANRAGGALYFRVSPKTQLLTEIVLRDYEYLASTSSLDNKAMLYYIGAKWELTAKTTGSYRIGHEKKDFDSSGIRDVNTTSWDVNITYEPKTYSTFMLVANKGNAEGSLRSNAITTTNTTLSWNHEWSPLWKSSLSYNFMKERYEGLIFDGRKDDTQTTTLSLIWMPLRRVGIEFAYAFRTRDSNSSIEEFDRQVFGISSTFYF